LTRSTSALMSFSKSSSIHPVDPMSISIKTVIKRDGRSAPFVPSKILTRLQRLKRRVEQFLGREMKIDVDRLAVLAQDQLVDGITTSEIDVRTAQIAHKITDHPDYSLFAGNLLMSNLEKNNFAYVPIISYAKKAYKNSSGPLISDTVYNAINDNEAILTKELCMDRNWTFDYISMTTLLKGQYLLNEYREVIVDGKRVRRRETFETPQHAFLRMSLAVYPDNIDKARELYNRLSLRKISMPTPCWFNLGTPHQSVISCFLFGVEDSLRSIYGQLNEAAMISKGSGGEGIWWHNVRSKGAHIKGTNGTSNGLVPAMKVYQATAQYVDQGGGKRTGSFAMYIAPWHPDALAVIRGRRNVGTEADQLHGLHTALWIPDVYYERLAESIRTPEGKKTVMWSFFDPNTVGPIVDLVGKEFTEKYEELERKGLYVRQMPIYAFHEEIMTAQVETGEPYMLSADNCNRKSNQKNLGTIKSSNLCTEIVEYSHPSSNPDENETACCNLCSIVLQTHVNPDGTFDFVELEQDVRVATQMMNRIIDLNLYPTAASRRSNERHRPLAMGVQGLADVFALMDIPYDSDQAQALNREIFEHMYFAALDASCTLAESVGPYPSIDKNGGAPIRRGIFHFELDPNETAPVVLSMPDRWEELRTRVVKYGTRNSLLIGPMPTASTANIMMSNECFEPFYTNVYNHQTMHAEFTKINAHLVRSLEKLGLWSTEMRDRILGNDGSVQGLAGIPERIQAMFKTVWEIPRRRIWNMTIERAWFVDQSQSFNNYFIDSPELFDEMVKALIYGWKRGLKTSSYYTRVHKTANKGVMATSMLNRAEKSDKSQRELRLPVTASARGQVCDRKNKEGCEACSG